MHADFAAAAKAARAQIAAPPVNIDAIRDRSHAAGVGARLRARIVSSAIALGILGTAAALAANAGGVRVWMFGDKATLAIRSFAMTYQPRESDVRAVMASAAFPVVLPAGVPNGSHIAWIAYSPADHPTFLTISYVNASSKRNVGVSIVDSSAIESTASLLPSSRMGGPVYRWQVGKETVFVPKAAVQPSVVQRIENAMANATSESSVVANAPFLASAVILPRGPRYLTIAARYAPAGGNSIVLGRLQLRTIAKLAREGKPVLDTRTVYLTNIPQVHGRPDYAHATAQWPKTIAIPADGVRQVAAALDKAGIGPTCDCAILVHRSGSSYTFWKIDAKTLKVTPLRN